MVKYWLPAGLAIVVLLLAVQWKFNYPTAIGPKRHFSDCKVKKSLDGEFTNEWITIAEGPEGIKFVEAETVQGAAFGLGFLHAQDRLW